MTDVRSHIIPFKTPYAPRRQWVEGYGFCVEQSAAIAYLNWRKIEASVDADGALCWQLTEAYRSGRQIVMTGKVVSHRVEAVFVSATGWLYPLDALRV